jgi:hypothetical protein
MLGEIICVPLQYVEKFDLQPICKITGIAQGIRDKYVNLIGLKNNNGIPVWFEKDQVYKSTEPEQDFYYKYLQHQFKHPPIKNLIFLGCCHVKWITIQLYYILNTKNCLSYHNGKTTGKILALDECEHRMRKLENILRSQRSE